MGGAGRFGGLLLAVATLGSTLAGCSNEDPRAANSTTTVADDNSPPSEVTIAVTVDSGGSASAPTRIRVGRREPVTLEGGRVDATKTDRTTGLVTAETAEGRQVLAAVVPADEATFGAIAEVKVSAETTAASLAFRAPGQPTGEPAVDLIVLACIYADPGLAAATSEVERLLGAGGDPVTAPDPPLLLAVNAIVTHVVETGCGSVKAGGSPTTGRLHGRSAPGPAMAGAAAPTATAAALSPAARAGSCIAGGLIDPDGAGANVACAKLDAKTSVAKKAVTAGKPFTVTVTNPTPRWVILQDATKDGPDAMLGAIAPKQWAIPGLQDLIVQFGKDAATALANEACKRVSFGFFCDDGITFGEAWDKVVKKVTSALADAVTDIEMPASAWGRPFAMVSFGSGTNGEDATTFTAAEAAPSIAFTLTLLTEILLPAAGLVGDLNQGQTKKQVKKSLKEAFAAALADVANAPDPSKPRKQHDLLEVLLDVAVDTGPALTEFLSTQSASQSSDPGPFEAFTAAAKLVQPFFKMAVKIMSEIDWRVAFTALHISAILDPAGLVEDLVVSTIKKFVPGLGWVELIDTGIDIVNLFGSSAELLVEMSGRAWLDIFWIGEHTTELPKRPAVTGAELAALDGTALCRSYVGDQIAEQEAMYPEMHFTGSPGVWRNGELIDATDGPAFALGDFDGDSVGDGAVAIYCNPNAGSGSSYQPHLVVILPAATRKPIRADDPEHTSYDHEVNIRSLSPQSGGKELRIDSVVPRPFTDPGYGPDLWRTVKVVRGKLVVIDSGSSGPPAPSAAMQTFWESIGDPVPAPIGDGCNPQSDVLPDGRYFGFIAVAGITDGGFDFDLACYLSSARAEARGDEVIEESTIENGSTKLRRLTTAKDFTFWRLNDAGFPGAPCTAEEPAAAGTWESYCKAAQVPAIDYQGGTVPALILVKGGTVIEAAEFWLS
ncbi:MAG TPA: hypothetical protein PKD80_06745 [Microthrixaceae bacterium]|nr:hypothetical protein [Microthrixaceae bacterium]HMT24825.1 hypothetical protein [Microthrixaceae bacterium]HMT60721.1 hypothetical protein [Microthrixaceae bacterium]